MANQRLEMDVKLSEKYDILERGARVSAVEQGSQSRWRSWLAPVGPCDPRRTLALSWPSPSSGEGRDRRQGLPRRVPVLMRENGEFRIVRPGAQHGWPAASDKVCEP